MLVPRGGHLKKKICRETFLKLYINNNFKEKLAENGVYILYKTNKKMIKYCKSLYPLFFLFFMINAFVSTLVFVLELFYFNCLKCRIRYLLYSIVINSVIII